MEEAFFDERVAPYVRLRVWLILLPLLLAELALLAAHHRSRSRAHAHRSSGGGGGSSSTRVWRRSGAQSVVEGTLL